MTILAVDNDAVALRELVAYLQTTLPQENIVSFDEALLALHYAANHPKEIGLLFSAIVMRNLDGIALAKSVQIYSPGAAIYYTVQSDSPELSAVARQHGNGECLLKPVTAEAIEGATRFLFEPCILEDECCEAGCLSEWCEHKCK